MSTRHESVTACIVWATQAPVLLRYRSTSIQEKGLWLLCDAGDGLFGQLGNGGITFEATPVAVSGSYSFTQLTAGRDHTCGLLGNGSALCWGKCATRGIVVVRAW